MNRLNAFFNTSFQRKLLFFNILLVAITTISLFALLIWSFRQSTNQFLQKNEAGIREVVDEYLANYTKEKATSTWLQINAAQNSLAILGQTAQKLVDNYDELQAYSDILELSIFETDLVEENNALTSSVDDPFDVLIPPPYVNDERALEWLELSALLNLTMDTIYTINQQQSSLVYFVGDLESPITRAYPNKRIGSFLYNIPIADGVTGLDLHFWNDFFAGSTDSFTRWYTDANLQSNTRSPITVTPPYDDAAGQGEVVTMFYPLWDSKVEQFAGAVGIDLQLNPIIEEVLQIRVAQTGFAFLIDGQGNIIAMPEEGLSLFEVELEQVGGSLKYFKGQLGESTNTAVKQLQTDLLAADHGILELDLIKGSSALEGHFIAYESLPALSSSDYTPDQWRLVLVVPKAEIFAELIETQQAVRQTSNQNVLISALMMVGFLFLATIISTRFSRIITSDLRRLVRAADKITEHDFNLQLDIQSQDELGQLGNAFSIMSSEIKDYTTNLEEKVMERTVDLQKANGEITRLNDQLKDENLRLSAELDVAQRLQMMVLPSDEETAAIPELDIAGYMQPADEVGGDFYDVVQVGDYTYLGIGDVTGHGLSSGVVMLMAQTAFLTLSQSGETDIDKILAVLNQVLYRNILRIRENKNMTLSVIRYQDNKFDLVGQHETVILCRTTGEIEIIDTMDLGFPVGLEDDIAAFLDTQQFELQADDVMLLYTDGITEAENPAKEMFGMDELVNSLKRCYQKDAKGIRDFIMEDLHTFIDSATIYDDISMLVIKQK